MILVKICWAFTGLASALALLLFISTMTWPVSRMKVSRPAASDS